MTRLLLRINPRWAGLLATGIAVFQVTSCDVVTSIATSLTAGAAFFIVGRILED